MSINPLVGSYPHFNQGPGWENLSSFCIAKVRTDPSDAEAYFNLALTLESGESVELADGTKMSQKELYLKTIDLDPEYHLAYLKLALTLSPNESVTLLNGTLMSQQQLCDKSEKLFVMYFSSPTSNSSTPQ